MCLYKLYKGKGQYLLDLSILRVQDKLIVNIIALHVTHGSLNALCKCIGSGHRELFVPRILLNGPAIMYYKQLMQP